MENSDMNYEQNRFQTLSDWPINNMIDKSGIARAGFYSTENNIEVICHWCQKKITAWELGVGDQIMKKHREINPICPFVQNSTECGNIPIATTERNINTIDAPSINSQNSPRERETIVPDYKNEQYRLSTFKNWPIPYITPESLAKAGFYYFDSVDRVKCAWCEIIVGQWEVGDNPFSEHQRLFPSCPKVQLGPNIEIASDGIRELGIQQIRSPKEPRFSSLDARMRTYQNWPLSDVQNPEELAEAGFYYQGTHDQVRCFHCNGGLRYWLPEDDPWFEHCRWFPKCPFVQLVKGMQYVKNIQEQIKKDGVNLNREAQASYITLDEAMSTDLVQLVLLMGLNEGRIRAAVKQRIESSGKLFVNAEQLIEAVLDGQYDEEEPSDISPPLSNRIRDLRQNDYEFEHVNLSSNQFNNTSCTINKPQSNNPLSKESSVTEVNKIESQNENDNANKLSLEEENRKLKDARLCKVCMDGEVGVVFLPCGHLVTCVQCAPGVTMCPLCRSSIKGFVRTFLS